MSNRPQPFQVTLGGAEYEIQPLVLLQLQQIELALSYNSLSAKNLVSQPSDEVVIDSLSSTLLTMERIINVALARSHEIKVGEISGITVQEVSAAYARILEAAGFQKPDDETNPQTTA